MNERRAPVPPRSATDRSDEPPPPATLGDARDATLTALLVRQAVDERRMVDLGEVVEASGPSGSA